jgi:hypothetical protein
MQVSKGKREARRAPAFLVSVLLFSTACTGAVIERPNGAAGGESSGGPGTGAGSIGNRGPSGNAAAPGAVPDCRAPSPGSAPLRRLSNAEYRNTLEDLFAGSAEVKAAVATATAEFPAEPESLGFRNSAEFLIVQPLLAQKYMDAAETIAERAAQSPGVVPCTPRAGAEMECARIFIADFGERAYRRELTSEERARLEAQFQRALTSYGFAAGVEWTIFGVLQSPSFLYRVEAGEPAGNGGLFRPTGQEMASRLSYLFWQSQPDAELLGAADSGELATAAGVERAARRLLADPRSARLFQYFSEWLDLDRLADFSRDPAIFKELAPELPALMEEESRTFVRALLARQDGNLSELLTGAYTYANKKLATHYGLGGASGSDFVRVDAPHASGVLTQAMLAVQDKPYRTSIVRRGLKVRTDLLCQTVPAPPDDVPLNLEALGPDVTQRERLEQHRSDPNCASCHALLDPIGVVFENFDAVGRYREKDESGDPIVSTSTISATRDANGAVASVRELGALLAASTEVRECYVKQTFRFFFGRDVEVADHCSIQRMNTAFTERNQNLAELLVALTQTDAFLYRNKNQEASP